MTVLKGKKKRKGDTNGKSEGREQIIKQRTVRQTHISCIKERMAYVN